MVDVAAAAANSALFDGIRPEDRSAMLTCLGAQTKTVRKGEFLVLAQDEVRYIGVVLSGEIHMIHEDRWGGTRPCWPSSKKAASLGKPSSALQFCSL